MVLPVLGAHARRAWPHGAGTSATACSRCCTPTTCAPRAPRACRARQVIRRHALRNALIPFVTVVAIDAGVLLGGVVVVEQVFSWPGLGLLFFDALERSDYPVILAWMAVATVFVVLFNLARRHPLRRARPAHPRERLRTTTTGACAREHAGRRRVGPGPGRGARSRSRARGPVHAQRRAASGAWPGAGSAATGPP